VRATRDACCGWRPRASRWCSPEGTFDEVRAIRRFHGGAFATALRSNMPVVAAAIHGSRALLPPGGLMIFRRPIRFEILAVLEAADARRRSRELIAAALGEPLATDGV
jgi:1-acyl-sn-glycerol-3-phosphate acyltransferase